MIEFAVRQKNCKRNKINGDVAYCIESEDIVKAVLCDGLGHGIKANLLANITAKIVQEHDFETGSLEELTKQLLLTQPICSIRKMNHSTYTVLLYDKKNNEIMIVNYDNPKPIVFLDNQEEVIQWIEFKNETYKTPRPQKMLFTKIKVQRGLTIVMVSDGVTESGVGNGFAFGWGERNLKVFCKDRLALNSKTLATKIISKAIEHERDYPHDDISCIVVKVIK